MGKQLWGIRVVVQAVKIRLGMKLTWVWLKRCISWICLSGSPRTLRDVHPVKTVRICPRKQLQESVGHAACVDTCSDAHMWPDSQSAGVSAETTFHFIFLSLCHFSFFPVQWRRQFFSTLSLDPNSTIDFDANFRSHSWHSLSLRGFLLCVSFFWHKDVNMQKFTLYYFRRRSEGLVIKRASRHRRLKCNSTPLRSTPHSLADV